MENFVSSKNFCTKCGSSLKSGAKFCTICGTKQQYHTQPTRSTFNQTNNTYRYKSSPVVKKSTLSTQGITLPTLLTLELEVDGLNSQITAKESLIQLKPQYQKVLSLYQNSLRILDNLLINRSHVKTFLEKT